MDFWQRNMVDEDFDRLAKDLGILWTREDVQEQSDAQTRPSTKLPNQLRIPLSLSIEPSLMETVRNTFGRKLGILPPDWATTGEVVDLFDTEPDEFLNFVRTFVRPKVVGKI